MKPFADLAIFAFVSAILSKLWEVQDMQIWSSCNYVTEFACESWLYWSVIIKTRLQPAGATHSKVGCTSDVHL